MSSEQISKKDEKDGGSNSNQDDNTGKRMTVKPDSAKAAGSGKRSERDLADLTYQGLDIEERLQQKDEEEEEEEEEEKIAIDYMAKDYASFRNALLDLIPRKVPQWNDKSEPDTGIMLIELFSYIADELSYFQDRVANEAFLRTARSRSSISNHLSLIDYQMQNGLSANAFIKVEVNESAIIPAGFQFSTNPQMGRGGKRGRGEESAGIAIFETFENQLVDHRYNKIPVLNMREDEEDYDNSSFSNKASAILEGDNLELKKGQHICLFEEDPVTHAILRQTIVKLAEDSKNIDEGNKDVLITWEKEKGFHKFAHRRHDTDFFFCCANILRASHGRTVESEILKQNYQEVSKFLFTLKEAPLAFISDINSMRESHSTLKVWVDSELWEETDNLLTCGPLDEKFSISIDEEGYATIQFGDGKFGKKPNHESLIEAEYRVGSGSVGNVGKETLTQFHLPHNQVTIVGQIIKSATNPLPATGGRDIESMEDAKIAGPKSLGTRERAVTLSDYEGLIKREFQNEITNARARFVHTGSWDTLFVSLDYRGYRKKVDIDDAAAGSDVVDRIRKYLDGIKMIGHEVQIEEANYVPIEISITVYIEKYFDSENVRNRIRSALSNKVNKTEAGNIKGFFHPDNFTFGDPVYASKIYEVLKDTPEVKYGVITVFKRRRNKDTANPADVGKQSPASSSSSFSSEMDYSKDEETKSNLDLGYIPIDQNEIITIDTEPSLLENGILILNFVGDQGNKDNTGIGADDSIVDHDYFLYDENSAW